MACLRNEQWRTEWRLVPGRLDGRRRRRAEEDAEANGREPVWGGVREGFEAADTVEANLL